VALGALVGVGVVDNNAIIFCDYKTITVWNGGRNGMEWNGISDSPELVSFASYLYFVCCEEFILQVE
jgi:hypothetical protein